MTDRYSEMVNLKNVDLFVLRILRREEQLHISDNKKTASL